MPTVKPWTNFCPKLLPLFVRQPNARWDSAITTFSLSAVLFLHHGQIAEMKTGEGKTLVATLAAYLNALPGKGVHIVTVNDYLARRDAEWMGQIYRFLGLTVDYIIHEKTDEERRAAYNSDIIYATNNELGFDYLRDNMKFSLADMVQRPFNYAIVDEVDSILIDEARTPLIISGAAEDSSEKYILVNKIIPHLTDADYEKRRKSPDRNFDRMWYDPRGSSVKRSRPD